MKWVVCLAVRVCHGFELWLCKYKRIVLKTKGHPKVAFVLYGAPEEIRTPDPLVRSQVLYPAELRAREA